uniref:Uncharacterized protein n=1 Tax=Brassica oleracea TaxID=3712 RepID=A0A3P6GBU9_BRAOL|nr:unnamed protein product [Brassica oleracea]
MLARLLLTKKLVLFENVVKEDELLRIREDPKQDQSCWIRENPFRRFRLVPKGEIVLRRRPRRLGLIISLIIQTTVLSEIHSIGNFTMLRIALLLKIRIVLLIWSDTSNQLGARSLRCGP